MERTDPKTHRDKFMVMGCLVFLANTLFSVLTTNDTKLLGFVIDGALRSDIWYCSIYLAFVFLFCGVDGCLGRLAFWLSVVRFLYNFCILVGWIRYGDGWSDILAWAIMIILATFDEIRIR